MDARSVVMVGLALGSLGAASPPPVASRAPAEADTPWVDVAPQPPTARDPSFRDARGRLKAVVRRALGAWADSARWSSGPVPYVYRDKLTLMKTIRGTCFWAIEPRDTAVTVPGLRMTLDTHVAGAPGSLEIERALGAAGWTRDGIYDADGPDGTHFVMICREALCDVQASWDGGDDSDTTYAPVPGERIELVCVPRPPRDPRASRR